MKKIIDSGILESVISFGKTTISDYKILLDILWIISNVAADKSSSVAYVVALGGESLLLDNLTNSNLEIVEQSIWGLSNIAGDNANHRDLLHSKNIYAILQKVMALKRNDIPFEFWNKFAWLVGNLVRGKPPIMHSVAQKLFNIYTILL